MRTTSLALLVVAVGATRAAAQPDPAASAAAAEKSAAASKASAEESACSAAAAKESAAAAARSLNEAKNVAAFGAVQRQQEQQAAQSPASAKPTGTFDAASFIGTTQLIAGQLTENGDTLANGGIGFIGTTKHWALRATFTFGTDGDTESTSTAEDFANYLHVPAAALSGDIHVRYHRWVRRMWIGGSLNLRVSHKNFEYAEDASEKITAIGIDPSVSLTLEIDKAKDAYFIVEAGLATRFWNKPGGEFRDALDLDSSKHAYFGPRGLAAITLGHIHVGVEMMRLWGGDFDGLKEFALIPYVGFQGGLAPEPEPDPEEEAEVNAFKRARGLNVPARPARRPPATPVM